jgi:hypothetical protein
VTNLAVQFNAILDRRPPVALRCWWILAFAVSFLVLFGTLLFLAEDAYAKPVGETLKGALGGGTGDGGHDNGGHKDGGGGGRYEGNGGRSPIKEVANTVGGGAQHGGQALKDASGNINRAVEKGAEPASEVAGLRLGKDRDGLGRISQSATDKYAEIARPLLKETGPLVEPVNNVTKPVVTTAGQAAEPVGAAASALVEPATEATRSVVEPVKEVVAPTIGRVGDTAGAIGQALDPVVEPLGRPLSETLDPTKPILAPVEGSLGEATEPLNEIASPILGSSPVSLVSEAAAPLAAPPSPPPDTEGVGIPAVEPSKLFESLVGPSSVGQLMDATVEFVAVKPMDRATNIAPLPSAEPLSALSTEGAVVSRGALSNDRQGSLGVSYGAFASGLDRETVDAPSSAQISEAPVISKTLDGEFLASLRGDIPLEKDVLPIQILQLLGAAGVTPAGGSFAGGSSSVGGGISLGALILLLISLLVNGKFTSYARELLKPSSTLLPIIERPG